MEEKDRMSRTFSDRRGSRGKTDRVSADAQASVRQSRIPADGQTAARQNRVSAGGQISGRQTRPGTASLRTPGVPGRAPAGGQTSGRAGRTPAEGQTAVRSGRISEGNPASDRQARAEKQPGRRRIDNKETGGRRPQGLTAGRRRPEEQETRQRRQPAQRIGNRKRPARGQQSKRRRQRNLIVKGVLLIFLVVGAVAAAFLWKKYSPSKVKYDLAKYYGIENEGQLAITINNEVVEPHGSIEDGKVYIQYDIVRKYINSRFYWDSNENVLLYTLPNDTVTVEVGSKDYTVSKEKKSEDYVILRTEGSTAYIALDFIQQYTNIDYELYNKPSRVMIVSDWGETTVAAVKRNTQVRYLGGVKSPVLTEVKKKDEVTIVESGDNWSKVRTKDGLIGYIKNSKLKKEETKEISRPFEEPKFTNISKDYTINLAWHNVTNTDANNTVLQRIAESKGLTTISPTWFHVKDTAGNMDSIASADYVNYAHQSGIEVWAAIRDFDGGISSYDESYEMLRYTSRRENLINQLVSESLRVGVDGINVDFEKISEECGEHYIQFIRELSVRCRQNGLVLSIDNYVPKGYNMQYDRKEQGIVADYIIIMGYDEHYAGSPVAGPVSSYNFVKEGIQETLKEVPAEKVISGIPFFTRIWQERPKTAEELAAEPDDEAQVEGADSSISVSSEAYDMATAKAKVAEAGVELTWDEETQQNYASWTVDTATYKVWLEDEQSIEPKLKLMKEHKLAGTAAWALGQESAEVWTLIQKYIN